MIEHRAPSILFHGAQRRIVGGALQPAGGSMDYLDPVHAAVFATPLPAYAALFALKSDDVPHVALGEPSLLISGPTRWAGVGEGLVFALNTANFEPISPARWCSKHPVPIHEDEAIRVPSPEKLARRGVLFLSWPGGRADAGALRDLIYSGTREEVVGVAAELTSEGVILDNFDSIAHARWPRVNEAAWRAARTSSHAWTDLLDSWLVPFVPFRTSVRVTHGLDHAVRVAVLSRVLSGWLREAQGTSFSDEDAHALTVAALLHDVARTQDWGPDTAEAGSISWALRAAKRWGGTALGRHVALLLEEKHRHPHAPCSVPSALLQTADALELMRNYHGVIDLSMTALAQREGVGPGERASLNELACDYFAMIRQLGSCGVEGGIIGFGKEVLVQTASPNVSAAAILRRCLSLQPAADCVEALKGHPRLHRHFARSFES